MCLEKNSRDNMTIVIVCFPGIKMASQLRSNVVLNRRAVQRARILETHAKNAAANTVKSMGLNFTMGSNDVSPNGITKKKQFAENKSTFWHDDVVKS